MFPRETQTDILELLVHIETPKFPGNKQRSSYVILTLPSFPYFLSSPFLTFYAILTSHLEKNDPI